MSSEQSSVTFRVPDFIDSDGIEYTDIEVIVEMDGDIRDTGTNSHDRRIATEWVIRALMLRGAIGAISTHDLALTEIATNGLPGRNVFFEDSGESGTLSFDYKLREGILTRSNALNIAHILGIDTAASSAIKLQK